MNQRQANAFASVLGGEAWHSGGGIWLVLLRGQDGRIVAFSDDLICEYRDESAFFKGSSTLMLELPVPAGASLR